MQFVTPRRDEGSAPVAARRLLVVWHSATGASRQLALAVAAGALREARPEGEHSPADALRPVAEHSAGETAVDVDCRHARGVTAAAMLAADAYVFVAPENLGSLAGVMKHFFDRLYYPLLERIAGRPYALVIAAGSDGRGAVRQVERICTGWRLRAVGDATIVLTDAQTPERILAPKRVDAASLARAGDLGQALAAGLALGIY